MIPLDLMQLLLGPYGQGQIGPARGVFPGQPGYQPTGEQPFNAGAFHNFVGSPRTESPFKGLSSIGGRLGQFDQPPAQPAARQLPPTSFGRSPQTKFPPSPSTGTARMGQGLPPEFLRLLMGVR